MNTKAAFLCLSMIVVGGTLCAQIDLEGKVKDKVNQRVDERTDQAIDKGLDEIEETATGKNKKEKEAKKEKETAKKEETNSSSAKAQTSAQQGGNDLKSYSKFDFVPGEKVVFFEDFTNGEIGDFPVNWNTSGTGELVTVNNAPGRWLKWSAGVSYSPMLKEPFPDNFTMEFDILMTESEDMDKPYFGLVINSGDRDDWETVEGSGSAGTYLFTQGEWEVYKWSEGQEVAKAGGSMQIHNSSLYNKKTRISIWGQKQRLRVYVNETKVLDLPQGIPAGAVLNRIKFVNNPGLNLGNETLSPTYISNIRIATGMPDMRSKLITEGKLVTRGITFDSGSDKIKAESYGTLKDIAAVLKENAAVKVKIIGHTDNDGADASNLDLSKKRAAAVKNALSKEFGIDASRMETDGKGESDPASPNTTPEGKANNRRVEFIKL